MKLLFHLLIILNLAGCSLDQATKSPTAVTGLATSQFLLVNYTASQATVSVTGPVPSGTTTPQNLIQFFTTADCKSTTVGQGLASAFVSTGIQIVIPLAPTTEIYASTNTLLGCYDLGQFVFNPDAPSPPLFSKSIPSSPSRTNYTPAFVGTALSDSTVNLYSDSICTVLVGTGSTDAFENGGILTTLPQNTKSTIYGQVIDSLGHKSTCAHLTDYQHSTVGPSIPVFATVTPMSPNNVSATPLIAGTVSADTTTVSLFSDAGCSTQLATGTKADFTTTGLQVTATANMIIAIYGEAFDANGNPSACTFLTNYNYDTIPPQAPTYMSANPASPTRLTIYPKISGNASSDTNRVRFYNSMLCLNQIGEGSRADFITTGVIAGVTGNAITAIYAASVDAAGNVSPCVHMTDYLNNTIPPDLPVYSATTPVSPNNVSATPLIFGNASETTVTVNFFSDMFCTAQIGTGTANQFNTVGIQLTTPSVAGVVNSTDIYANAVDAEGNISDCAPMTTYAYSTMKAPAPTFSQTIPASPSRVSFKPYILGTANKTVVNVRLFTDVSCTQLVGSASRSVFAAQGIPSTLPANTISSLYAISTDIYGNTSDCTYFAQYTHDNIQPTAPGFVATVPTSPNNQSTTPMIQGSVIINEPGKPLPVSKVTIFDGPTCLTKIGFDTPVNFAGSGVLATVVNNTTTTVYGQTSDAAGNKSTCTFLINYTTDTNPPGNPQLISATPTPPSYTQMTNLVGSLSANFDIISPNSVSFYRDAACSDLISSGTATAFVSTGVPVLMDENTTTTVYGQTTDYVTNTSACVHLIDFLHNDIGPTGLTATQNLDGSIGLTWGADLTANPPPSYVVKRALKSGGPYAVLAWANAGTSYTDRAVTNGVTYYYVVDATNNTGTSFDSAEVSITASATSTQSPTALIATPGPSLVTLQWTGYSPDMFFKILRATQSGGPYTTVATGLNGTQYNDTNLTNGTAYYYVMVATNPSGDSLQSNEASATPQDISGSATNLTAIPLSSIPSCGNGPGVVLTWGTPNYFTNFAVGVSQTSGSENDIPGLISGSTYTHCNPSVPNAPGILHYTVTALWGPVGAQVRAPPSNEVSVEIGSAPTVTVKPGHNEIFISWPTMTRAISYQIWKSSQSGWPDGSYVLLDGAYGANTYHDTAVTDGHSYFYTVIANYAAGSGFPSLEASGTPMAAPGVGPSNLVIIQTPGGTQPLLNWTAPPNYNSFNIYQATNIGGPYSPVGSSTNSNWTDSLSIPGTYYYKITAQWGSFETAASNIVSYTFGAPLTLTISPSSTSLALTWGIVSGASSYQVLRGTSSGGPYTTIASAATTTFVNSTAFPVGNAATAGQGYYYVVRPILPGPSTGENSPEVSGMLTTSSRPSGLTVVNQTTSSVNLVWANMKGVTGYTIYKSANFAGPYSQFASSPTNSANLSGGLLANTTYYFTVSTTSCGIPCQSTPVVAYTNSYPSAPAASPGNNSATVQWSGLTGATSYNILRSTDLVTFTTVATGATGGLFTDNGLTNGYIYFYEIQAVYPTQTLVSPPSLGVTPGVTPTVPQGLTMLLNNDGTDVTVAWGSNSGTNTYNIYLAPTSSGPWGSPYQSTSSSTGTLISGLTPGQVYYVAVSALNGSLESGLSTPLAFIPTVTPAAPTATVVANNSVKLQWGTVSGAATYDLYRSTDSQTFSLLTAGLAGLTYSDVAVSVGGFYYYQYLPRDASGRALGISGVSSVVTLVQPLAATQLSLMAPNTTTVNLAWVTSSTPQVASYNIYRSSTSGGPYTLRANLTSPTNTYSESGLTPGSSYFYVVTAVNTYGGESNNSNEVGTTLRAGPATLSATVSGNAVALNWSSVTGALGYVIQRSLTSGGPYGIVGTVGVTNTLTDTNIKNGVTYYYVAQAILAQNALTVNSAEASVTAVKTLNLRVPIEMTDQGLSSDSVPITFERTRTSLDPTAYDGTITYQLEVVADNASVSAATINLVDSSGTVRGHVTVPAGTTSKARIAATVTPNASADEYRLQLMGTNPAGILNVYAARLFVNQTGASKTRLFIPLLSSPNSPSLGDLFSPTESTTASGYKVLKTSSIYKRDLSHLSHLIDYNPWEFEALVATGGSTGLIALYDTTTSAVVADSEVDFNSQTVTLVSAQIDDGVTNFASPTNDGDQYQVAFQCYNQCSNGSVSVYKAGLWVNLTDLTAAEIIFRTNLAEQNISGTSNELTERTFLDLGKFSNPVVNFRATALVPSGTMATVTLMTDGSGASSDSDVAGLMAVTGSDLSFNFSALPQQLQTASPLALTSQDRFVSVINPSGGPVNFIDSALVVDISQ